MIDVTTLLISIIVAAIGILYAIYYIKFGKIKSIEDRPQRVPSPNSPDSITKPKEKLEKKSEKAPAKVKNVQHTHENNIGILKGGSELPKTGTIISISTSSKYVVQIRDNDAYVRLWKVDSLLQPNKIQSLLSVGKAGEYATAVAISPNSDLLAFATDYNTIRLFLIDSDAPASKMFEPITNTEFETHKKPITQLEFTQNGKYLLSLCATEDVIFVYNVES
ncbi:Poc1b [Acrasis kona]|uniref:Poc1b n=1 Tax=Acrasis kona TaxID=1008807 RepID=A0AAW2YLC0_9EUKA